MSKKINESKKLLTDKLMSLEETGPTALGPALLTGIAMAAEGAPGSQVTLCTDGLANIGIGNFDDAKSQEQMAKVKEFYERAGQYAKSKGLTINIVSIIADECDLETLSQLAELTGGEVQRVDPISLTKNFANINQLPIIATNVVAKIKLHKGLQFRNENTVNLSEDMSLLVKDLGNVTEETEITIEYTLKKISQLLEMEDLDLTQIKSFPFQTQITYNALDGSRCIRVITEQQAISQDRVELEKKADFNILGQNAVQQSANIARSGNHKFAQAYAKNWGRAMRKNANTEDRRNVHSEFVSNLNNLQQCMAKQDMMEQAYASDNDSMDEDEEMKEPEKKKGGFFGKIFGGGSAQ